jgi:predicted CopG family antitoxin
MEAFMKRTQIYIDDDIFLFLKKESKTGHRSISEIIRESIRDKYRYKSDVLLKRIDTVYGIWKNRKIDTDKYVRTIRKDRIL